MTSHAAYTAAMLMDASVVSQSLAACSSQSEARTSSTSKTYFVPAIAANPNVTFLAASGDGSAVNGPIFPSSSPLNVAVGGTTLLMSGDHV